MSGTHITLKGPPRFDEGARFPVELAYTKSRPEEMPRAAHRLLCVATVYRG